MNQRKPNISRWYILGLTAVLMIACLVGSVGITWARYRTQVDKSIYFTPREPVSVYLGQMEYNEDGDAIAFDPEDCSSWETEDGDLQVKFALANSSHIDNIGTESQEVGIRLIGSLGINQAGSPMKVTMTVENSSAAYETSEATAVASRITEGSPLYNTFGDGWVFTFLDADKEEVTWTLEGGQFSYIDVTVTVESGTLADASLLQLQITGERSEE